MVGKFDHRKSENFKANITTGRNMENTLWKNTENGMIRILCGVFHEFPSITLLNFYLQSHSVLERRCTFPPINRLFICIRSDNSAPQTLIHEPKSYTPSNLAVGKEIAFGSPSWKLFQFWLFWTTSPIARRHFIKCFSCCIIPGRSEDFSTFRNPSLSQGA